VIRFVAAVKDVGAQHFEGTSFMGWSTTSRPGKVGRCRLPISKPKLKASIVSALEAILR